MGTQEQPGSETSSRVALPDETVVAFRAVAPGDAPALQRLHARCSDRSIELRFLGHLGNLSDRKAARLALAAIDPGRPDEIVAVVRFEREAGGETAEYAALVEDRWQGLGLGQALTDRLIGAARDRGIRRLHALVAPGNERMLRLLRGLGLPVRAGREEGAELLEVDLGGPRGPRGEASGE